MSEWFDSGGTLEKIRKKNGFFLDIGAGDGVNISNTFILEKNFNWNGIVCDPLPTWHKSLEKNRKCIIDKRCVYKSSNLEMIFEDCYKCPEVSGLKDELESKKGNLTRLQIQ